MTNYLTKRGTRYYFRRKIPAELQAHFGKAEIMFSLGTSDRGEATARCHLEAVVYDKQFAAARDASDSKKASESVRAVLTAAERAAIDRQGGVPNVVEG